MRIGFVFFNILLFVHCTSRPQAEHFRSKVDNLNDTTEVVGIDSLDKVIQGKLLFEIEAREFFQKGSINDVGYGETSLKYLMPLTFYKDSDFFYIPDRSRLSLTVLNGSGKAIGSIKIPLNDFVFYKIERFHSQWYLIDFNKGLYVLDDQSAFKYRDEKTSDFHVDENLGNIYLENMLNDERALLDQNGVLKAPLKIDYLSCFVENSILFGISDKGNNQHTIIKKNLKDGSESKYFSFGTSCNDCFVMPSLLDENNILSSVTKPFVRDQITVNNPESLSVSHYLLQYPIKVNRLVSDVSASISYSGYVYFYDRPSKTLYSLCTDRSSIKVFSFDLKNLR
jgi:hypothetical protein